VARYGVVDIGSNGIRMILAEIRDGHLKVLSSRREHVRLGEDVYRDGRISDAVMDSVVAATRGFARDFEAASVQRAKTIATAATREAANSDLLVARVKQATGLDVEVISGDREAMLLCMAVRGRMHMERGRSLLLDLGGGSIELAAVDNGAVRGASFPLGALRLLRGALDATGLVSGDDFVAALRQQVQASRERLAALVQPPFDRFAVVGGSMETLEELAAEEGATFVSEGIAAVSLDALRALLPRLSSLTPTARQTRFRLPAERVDTIVPAAVVTIYVGELAGVRHVTIPRVDLRHGLLWELDGATLSIGDGDH